jgi:hypothetical protein
VTLRMGVCHDDDALDLLAIAPGTGIDARFGAVRIKGWEIAQASAAGMRQLVEQRVTDACERAGYDSPRITALWKRSRERAEAFLAGTQDMGHAEVKP